MNLQDISLESHTALVNPTSCSVDAKALTAALKKLTLIVGKGTRFPWYLCIIDGSTLTVSSPEIEASITVDSLNFPAPTCVTLYDLIRVTPKSGTVFFSLRDGELIVDQSIALATYSLSDFAFIGNMGEAKSPVFSLLEDMKPLLPLAKNPTRENLNGFLVDLRNKEIAATNGHHLISMQIQVEGQSDDYGLIPYAAVSFLSKMTGAWCRIYQLEQEGFLPRTKTPKPPLRFLRVEGDNVSATIRISQRDFPDWRALFSPKPPRKISVNKDDLAKFVEDAVRFSVDEKKIVTCTGSSDSMTLKIHSSGSRMERKILASGAFGLVFEFNAEYVANILKSQGKTITLYCCENNPERGRVDKPIIFIGEKYNALLMPTVIA